MPTVGLVLKRGAPRARDVARDVLARLVEDGIRAVAEPADAPVLGVEAADKRQMFATADAIVVLGGDGTLLATARLAGERSVPIVGANLGGLGFLTEVPPEEITETLAAIFAGQAVIDPRQMLRAVVRGPDGSGRDFQALNDAVLSRGALGRVVDIEARIDGRSLASFKGDGVIVATPTGSTAYALSAGGPIVHPAVRVLVLSPICPHTLNVRPLVIDDGARLELRLRSPGEELLLTLDGQETISIHHDDVVEVERSPFTASLVRSPKVSFFDLLRGKLGWARTERPMLRRLHVSDLALIEELTLDLGPGLNVVTGETGAGKSLLQRALALAAGHRSGSEVVREGADVARVEAEFDLPADGALAARLRDVGVPAEAGGTLVVRRTVARSGRGQVQMNERTVALATLAEAGTALVHLQGQHESLRLAQPETHLAMLDGVADAGAVLDAYRTAWAELSGLVARLEATLRGAAERERRLELARFDLDELVASRLADPDEESRLERDRLRLRSAERLREVVAEALERLHGGEAAALGGVESMARRIAEVAELDVDLAPIATALEEAAAPLGEAVRGLQAYESALDADPGRLDEIEDRLALFARLTRKHDAEGVAALIARRDALAEEIARSEADAANPEGLRLEVEAAAGRAWALADELSAARRAAAARLEREVERELASLGMAGARFGVRLEDLPAGPARGPAAALTRDGAGLGPDGADRAEFDLAANPGEGARPLARVASGGELSRIMLALRHVAGGDSVPTLVFDEVDAGIGGAAAEVVGRRLRSIAAGAQVVCITHLAQIAAFADLHYGVEKGRHGGRTRTRVAAVVGEERARELARMLGGDAVGAAGLEHAAEMLRRAAGAENDARSSGGVKPARVRAAAAAGGGRKRG